MTGDSEEIDRLKAALAEAERERDIDRLLIEAQLERIRDATRERDEAMAVPAAIVSTEVDGHWNFHAFETKADAVQFYRDVYKRDMDVMGLRMFTIDGPVSWHPAATGESGGASDGQ